MTRLFHPPRHFWLLVLLLTVVALFWLATIREGHVWGGDFSLYLHHARNLLAGLPYAETGYILNPADPVVSPQSYPPVFPLLLVPFYYLFGFNLTLFKLAAVFGFLLFLVLFIILVRKDLPFSALFALILTFAFNPFLWDFKDDIRSDIPFLLFTYAALYFAYHRAFKIDEGRRRVVTTAVLTALFCYLAYGTRTLGLVLPVVIILFDLVKQRRITLYAGVVGLTFVVGVGLQVLFFPASSYWEQYVFDPVANSMNVASYIITIATLWENGYSLIILLIVSIILLALALLGWWSRVRTKLTLFEAYTAVYLLVLALWPVTQGLRFLIPILPLFFFYIFWGASRLGAKLGGRWEKGLLVGITAVLILSYLGKYSTMPFDAISTGVGQPESVALFEYIEAHTEETAVIIFRKPRVLNLYTGRPAAIFHPETATSAEQWAFWREIGANYLIVGAWDEPHWQQFVRDNQPFLAEVYANSDFHMYHIERYPID